jgi:hypothetical protein
MWRCGGHGGSGNTVTTTGTLLVGVSTAISVAPPTITSISMLPDGAAQLFAQGTARQSYVVQATFNLAPTAWVNLGTNAAGSTGLFTFLDADAKNYAARFYRLMVAR